ncbi:FAAH [Bugula neritina]|uniref:FAAH n=1 Tax=Bugula neritina TaxID=10212 RepID=A0A7J7J3Q1_BUGNE|nr:FAAH [Bugula neritina]
MRALTVSNRLKQTVAAVAQKLQYRKLWIDDWNRKGIDVLLAPAVPIPAEFISPKKGCSAAAGAYAYPVNLVNFPAGVVPFGKITPEDEENDFRNYPDQDLMQRRLKENIKGSTGLPLSVQCVALPYREEMCLRVMNLISKVDQ